MARSRISFTVLAYNGEGWQSDKVKDGDYVVIFGHPAREGEPREVCPGGQPYTVERLMLNPQGGS